MEGRRGLLKLGQTCYLNVVLQSFVHNPLLRNYFLSDKHNSLLCSPKPTGCTSCEMDRLFTEVDMSPSSYIVESNGPTRYTRLAPMHTAQRLSWPQLGAPHPICPATASKMHTSSSFRLSIRFTQPPAGLLASPATVSYTLHSLGSCRVTSSVAVGMSQALSPRCWTSVW